MISNLFIDKEIIIFDMEVIDFELESNVLIQFAARKYVDNDLVDKLNIIIRHNPIELPRDFTQRTRITEGLVKKGGISLTEAKEKIKNFIKDTTLVSYKGNYFYFPLLWKIFDNELKNKTIDIIDIATALKLFDNPDDISLEEFAKGFNLDFIENKWHNASYDICIIEKIWFKLKSISLKYNNYEK